MRLALPYLSLPCVEGLAMASGPSDALYEPSVLCAAAEHAETAFSARAQRGHEHDSRAAAPEEAADGVPHKRDVRYVIIPITDRSYPISAERCFNMVPLLRVVCRGQALYWIHRLVSDCMARGSQMSTYVALCGCCRPGFRADARLPRLLRHQGRGAVVHAVNAVPAAGDQY